MLVTKMQAAAAERNYACDIHAYPVAEAREHEKDADMVLLGPQVRYMLGKVKEDCPNCAVEAIDRKAYGTMDGKSMIDHVITVLEAKNG